MAQKALRKNKPGGAPTQKRKTRPTAQKTKFRRDPRGTKLLHASIEQKAAAKAMRNEGVQFHIGDLNNRAKARLDEEDHEVKRKKEKKRTAVDGAVASLEHAIQGKRMKV